MAAMRLARLVRRSAALLLAWSAAAGAAPAWFAPTRVDDAPPAPEARTSHQADFNGETVAYDAVTGETVLDGEDGEPATTIFSTAYLRTNVEDPGQRPLLFAFNGGPGASSSPLHLGIGPVRRGADASRLVTNGASPLDAVDLVFIDPPGTGYSRLFEEGAGETFWGVEEDADAVLAFIGRWLDAHGRRSSPVYVLGESYGATRAVMLLARAQTVSFHGALLLSAALDFTAGTPVIGNNLPYVFLLPTMAATAAYHGVTRTPDDVGEVFERAAIFAQSDYAAALYAGGALAATERARVAQRLARLAGIPADFLLAQDLRLDGATFGDALLGDKGLRVGRLDTRITGLISEYQDKRPPGNDPSMSPGRLPGQPPGKADDAGPSTGELLDGYYREHLATRIDRPYRTLNLHINSKWRYQLAGGSQFYFSVVPLLQQAMQNDEALRVFIGGGLFDMGTPLMAARYAVSQIDVPRARFTLAAYEAGHSVFDHDASREALGRDIRAFVTEPPTP